MITPEQEKEIIEIIKKVMRDEMPVIFSRSLVQLKEFVIKEIT